MKISNKVIMGSALSVAAFLAAIDHTRNPVPEVKIPSSLFSSMEKGGVNPCSLDNSPCSLSLSEDKSPCSI